MADKDADFRNVPDVKIGVNTHWYISNEWKFLLESANEFTVTFEGPCTFTVLKLGSNVLIANETSVTNQDRAPVGSILLSINDENVGELDAKEINQLLETG